MEPVVVGAVVVFAVLTGLRFMAIREHANGDPRFVGLFFLPLFLGGIVMTVAGLWVVSKDPFTGILLLAIGAVSTTLVARIIVQGPRMARESSVTGDIPGPMLDYLIWAAIGIPMLFVALLIIELIAGGLRSG